MEAVPRRLIVLGAAERSAWSSHRPSAGWVARSS